MGSNPSQGLDVWCVCAFFCVCVVLCLGRGLVTSWSPVQGVLPSVNDQETEISALCSKVGARGRKKYNLRRTWVHALLKPWYRPRHSYCTAFTTTVTRKQMGTWTFLLLASIRWTSLMHNLRLSRWWRFKIQSSGLRRREVW
jgi:hypothetical protein